MKQLLADDPRSFKQQWRIRLGWLPLALVHTYKHMHVLLYTNVCIMICIHQLYNWSLAFRIGRVCVCVCAGSTSASTRGSSASSSGATPWRCRSETGTRRAAWPLYDKRRDRAHQPPFPIDLDYNRTDPSIPNSQAIRLTASPWSASGLDIVGLLMRGFGILDGLGCYSLLFGQNMDWIKYNRTTVW
jgi:polyphenol oxidase